MRPAQAACDSLKKQLDLTSCEMSQTKREAEVSRRSSVRRLSVSSQPVGGGPRHGMQSRQVQALVAGLQQATREPVLPHRGRSSF